MASVLMNFHRGLCQRIYSSSTVFVAARRTFVSADAPQRVPPPRDPSLFQLGHGPSARPAENITTTKKFLESIGRGMQEKVDQNMSWEELWKLDGKALRKAGLAVRDRRYLLWCMEKFRLGFPLSEFVHEPTPKKTIRGWGPKVQNGKRIRSRRLKDKSKRKVTT
ncbi:Protein FYV4, mitochondrial [Psilocybe cubensis]|uniref:Protein FYV4, mitochondrial n=2 Tax=Psilocybe cubensis TaxID=181762 RepID=A0ACB8GX51_PSICU|nr:Protein FYV4, mitochondrial [Psilocybe cubensis]KAH9480325.1 Protein FYV4, mitochondrial [Psilocybe cubensis]